MAPYYARRVAQALGHSRAASLLASLRSRPAATAHPAGTTAPPRDTASHATSHTASHAASPPGPLSTQRVASAAIRLAETVAPQEAPSRDSDPLPCSMLPHAGDSAPSVCRRPSLDDEPKRGSGGGHAGGRGGQAHSCNTEDTELVTLRDALPSLPSGARPEAVVHGGVLVEDVFAVDTGWPGEAPPCASWAPGVGAGGLARSTSFGRKRRRPDSPGLAHVPEGEGRGRQPHGTSAQPRHGVRASGSRDRHLNDDFDHRLDFHSSGAQASPHGSDRRNHPVVPHPRHDSDRECAVSTSSDRDRALQGVLKPHRSSVHDPDHERDLDACGLERAFQCDRAGGDDVSKADVRNLALRIGDAIAYELQDDACPAAAKGVRREAAVHKQSLVGATWSAAVGRPGQAARRSTEAVQGLGLDSAVAEALASGSAAAVCGALVWLASHLPRTLEALLLFCLSPASGEVRVFRSLRERCFSPPVPAMWVLRLNLSQGSAVPSHETRT